MGYGLTILTDEIFAFSPEELCLQFGAPKWLFGEGKCLTFGGALDTIRNERRLDGEVARLTAWLKHIEANRLPGDVFIGNAVRDALNGKPAPESTP